MNGGVNWLPLCIYDLYMGGPCYIPLVMGLSSFVLAYSFNMVMIYAKLKRTR
jgi:hypothetical protein